LDNHVKEDEVNNAYSTHGKTGIHKEFWLGKQRETAYAEDLEVGGRTI
jgi:hypothetical protein